MVFPRLLRGVGGEILEPPCRVDFCHLSHLHALRNVTTMVPVPAAARNLKNVAPLLSRNQLGATNEPLLFAVPFKHTVWFPRSTTNWSVALSTMLNCNVNPNVSLINVGVSSGPLNVTIAGVGRLPALVINCPSRVVDVPPKPKLNDNGKLSPVVIVAPIRSVAEDKFAS